MKKTIEIETKNGMALTLQEHTAKEQLIAECEAALEKGWIPNPYNKIIVDGEKHGPGPNIYGGGWWFVIQSDKIWYIRNNGRDGDLWAINNVQTGGAGAIGRWVPYNAELAEKIKKIKN